MVKSKKADSTKVTLPIEIRTVIGKKVKKIRAQGYIPATVYGPDYKSKSIQVRIKDFLHVYKTVHETGIVFLKIDSEEVPTLIKNLQRHPLSEIILHVDFRKIDLKQKMETAVPIKLVGESEAVTLKGAVLLTQAEFVNIEALPQDIPSNIEVDISRLKEIGQEIKIADLLKNATYEIKDPENKVIVSAIAHKEESVTPETAAPVTEVITEKEVEGEVPEETVKEEKKETVKKEESKKAGKPEKEEKK